MSPRLTTAIKISRNAEGLLHAVEAIDTEKISTENNVDIGAYIGIKPMLLALSMELALKAWYVFDHNSDDVSKLKTHNLLKLFEKLSPESQDWLDSEFRRSVAPIYPSGFHVDYGIKNILYQYANAFNDWRYLHEPKRPMIFEEYGFTATLQMTLALFRTRYREEKMPPPWTS